MFDAKRAQFRAVIGVDFTEAGAHAIFEAVQLARVMADGDLHFVHVVEANPDLYDAYVADALADHLSRTMIRLERYVRDALFTSCGHEGWRCEVVFHVRLGEPARAIHQVAVDVDAEMILVGADHLGGLRKFFHRSTAERLVRDAHVPVMVAHQKNFRGLLRSDEIEPNQISEDLVRSGLTLYGHVDFSESERDSSRDGQL